MYLKTYATILLLSMLLPAALIIAVDPYQVWHDRGFKEGLYSTNQRYQNAGLIRRFLECDDCAEAAVIVGTSISENTSIADIQDATGLTNAVRLITEGGKPIEHWYMLERALESGKVSTVFWEVYRNYVLDDYDQLPEFGSFPAHLYTKKLTDDYPYLFNHSVLTSIFSLYSGHSDWSVNLGTLNNWHNQALQDDRYRRWNRRESMELQELMYEARLAEPQEASPNWQAEAPVFEKFIKPLVDKYPDVDFIFFAPPVSLARSAQELQELMSKKLVLRKKLAELADQNDNISLYAFDLYLPLVTDMKYYKDERHFTAAINRWLLERMMAQDVRFILSADNVTAYGNRLWDMAGDYYPKSSCTNDPQTCGVFDPTLMDEPLKTD